MTEYYKHRNPPRDVVNRLVKFSGLGEHLVKSVLFFCKCMLKPHSNTIDYHIYSAVLRTYFDYHDELFCLRLFNKSCKSTKDVGMLLEDFAKIVCTYLTDKLDLKINYTFSLYNYSGSGTLDRTEVINNLQRIHCVTDTEETEKLETFSDICQMALEVLGMAKGETISLEEFRAKVTENHLVLDILGTCLPSKDTSNKFKELIQEKGWRELSEIFLNIRDDLLFEHRHKTLNEKYFPVPLDMYTL